MSTKNTKQAKTNQQNKSKETKKQQKQHFFPYKNFISKRKLFALCFDTSFSTQIFFLKKIKPTKYCLDSLIYYATDVYPPQLLYGELFSTRFSTIFFFITFTYIYLFTFIFICENLFICQNLYLYVRESLNLFALTFISENLFISVRISSCTCASIFIRENVFLSIITSEISYLRLRE